MKHMKILPWATALVLTMVILPVSGWTEPVATGDPYPLDTCIVSGMKLGTMGEPVIKVVEGREIRFCCKSCPQKFEASRTTYLAKIDAAIVAGQAPYYPLSTCPITGHELGTMGDTVDYVLNNRLVKLCCPECKSKIADHAEAVMKKLDEAATTAQRAAYPLDTCLVSGEKLGGAMGDPVEAVIAGRLFRTCCKGCVKKLRSDPAKYLSALEKAGGGTGMAPHSGSGAKHDNGQEHH